VRRGADALLGAQPGQNGIEIERLGPVEIDQETLLNQLPGERRRARAGAGIDHRIAQLHRELAAIHGRLQGDRVGAPARVVADQRRTADQIIEGDVDFGAVGQFGVRVQELAQHPAQQAGRQRLVADHPIDVQVQPRHVNAAHIRALEVDEGIDLGAGHDHIATGLHELDGHFDLTHAHPIELAGDRRLRFAGDVGHDPRGIFGY